MKWETRLLSGGDKVIGSILPAISLQIQTSEEGAKNHHRSQISHNINFKTPPRPNNALFDYPENAEKSKKGKNKKLGRATNFFFFSKKKE